VNRSILALLFLAIASPARAHHGVAAVSLAGPEGPGAALETTSALPLPELGIFVMGKSEYVSFLERAVAAPENKDHSSFNTLALGFGIRSWLSAYLFQPYSVKVADSLGRNDGFGDPSLMLVLAGKWDEGPRLVPERESLDELEDWHFSAWLSSTVPLASVDARDLRGEYFEPDMQTGFGAASPSAGIAATKQLGPDLTFLADASYQAFFAHTYAFTRYRFGDEIRLNAALAYRAFGRGALRVDVVPELNGLHLERDREESSDGVMAPLQASGGAILYAALGARVAYGSLSAALGIRRAAATALNESAEQQGSEGLEAFRASLALGWFTRF
jgi:hypothetical protein